MAKLTRRSALTLLSVATILTAARNAAADFDEQRIVKREVVTSLTMYGSIRFVDIAMAALGGGGKPAAPELRARRWREEMVSWPLSIRRTGRMCQSAYTTRRMFGFLMVFVTGSTALAASRPSRWDYRSLSVRS